MILIARRFAHRTLAITLLVGLFVSAGIEDRETSSFPVKPVLCQYRGEVSAEAPAGSERCMSGFWGPIGGKSIGAPARGASWARGAAYGRPSAGTTKSSTPSLKTVRQKAKERGVPWPSAKSKRARTDFASYNVYTIYARTSPSTSRTFKYGITKVGETRPGRQLKACRKEMAKVLGVSPSEVDCRWRWTREGIHGFYKARKIEAGYATNYKGAFGKCPPGMRRCL